MKFLLDSNVLFRMLTDRNRLTPKVLAILQNSDHRFFVSLASIWELAIKIAKGKLLVPGGNAESLLKELRRLRINVLPIEEGDVLRTQFLPHHHGEPFDRILIAQAIERDLTIITADQTITLYQARVVWR